VNLSFEATETVNSSDGKAAVQVRNTTGGRIVKTAIDAVGISTTCKSP